MMPIGDPLDKFFYPTLTLMIDTYIFAERNGSYDARNIAALPVQTDQLCGSPDVVQYLWSYGCHVTEVVTQFERETEENKCM